ncbi:MAG: hypothetical protein IH623_28325 [Verrucomicrobia bacterium]|nr:hypothetical protein [Verrucomicrobiota bacterium]
MKQIWILFMARRSEDILFGGNLLSDEVSFDIGSDCREPRFGSPDYAMTFQFGLWPFVASREIAEETRAVLERKFQKVVIARAEAEHSCRSFQLDLHGLADLHLFSNAIKRRGQLACGRADFLIREDVLQQFSNDRKYVPTRRLIAVGKQKEIRHVAGLLQSQPVIVVIENLENGQHAVCVWRPTDTVDSDILELMNVPILTQETQLERGLTSRLLKRLWNRRSRRLVRRLLRDLLLDASPWDAALDVVC